MAHWYATAVKVDKSEPVQPNTDEASDKSFGIVLSEPTGLCVGTERRCSCRFCELQGVAVSRGESRTDRVI